MERCEISFTRRLTYREQREIQHAIAFILDTVLKQPAHVKVSFLRELIARETEQHSPESARG